MSADAPTDAEVLDLLSALGPEPVARGLVSLQKSVRAEDWDQNFLASAYGLSGFLRAAIESHPKWDPDIGFHVWDTELLDIVAEVTGLGQGAFLLQWLTIQEPDRLAELSACFLAAKTGRPIPWKSAPPPPQQAGEPKLVRQGAVQFLRDTLAPEQMLKLFQSMSQTPRKEWGAGNHMLLGMGVRNALRAAGFNEIALGVESLDSVWADLLWEAVSS